MIRFEEFGIEQLPPTYTEGDTCPLPLDVDDPDYVDYPKYAGHPDSGALDAFLGQTMYPPPMELSNDGLYNPEFYGWTPWKSKIETYLGYVLEHPPAEGRPPGVSWSHQRYAEFPPEVYFKTMMAGARNNLGLRDSKQSHHYAVGEFKHADPDDPGTPEDESTKYHEGLYHNSVRFVPEYTMPGTVG